MMWRRMISGLLALMWLSGCAGGGLSSGDTLSVGQREADLVARLGQPQEIKPAPGGGRTFIYTTTNLDQMATMGGGAWAKPDQVYYDINAQGIITGVNRYPYGKHSFIFPTKEKPVQTAQAQAAGQQGAVVSASPPPASLPPATPAASPVTAGKQAPPPPAAADSMQAEASRLEPNMSREEVRRILGNPWRTEGFRAGGQAVVVWFYQLEGRQGRVNLTPLVFEGGRLSGWGENYYRLRLREITRQQP
jgi:hypothetical protein|uniref:DUF3192 domain-containing protein n=1 Tax=Desulfobacca acetoxidans TaxID=60893 RepID=A0A7V6A191_9BACT